ncbi:MAG: TIGR02757 family protein [Bacteroidales bacterium]|nr:TIGR02757 family protein [Bacteroidales bacterium]
MNTERENIAVIRELAERYNNRCYFEKDPIVFPRRFYSLMKEGKATLKDVEIAAVIAAHLAWGRRDMIVRDIGRAMDEMGWRPLEYVMKGNYRDEDKSLHRTIKWSEFARICANLKRFYEKEESLESLTPNEMRVRIYAQKSDANCANKKIHMLRRWMVRDDGIVDLGVWKRVKPSELIIPLDTHVHGSAVRMGITERKSADIKTALEITEFLLKCFPSDPCKGDFALFAYSARMREEAEEKNKKKKCK